MGQREKGDSVCAYLYGVGAMKIPPRCADCGTPIGLDRGPPDGWQLEDGRTVCHECCVADTLRCIAQAVFEADDAEDDAAAS